MSTISAFQSGLMGVQTGLNAANRDASQIVAATSSGNQSDVTEPLVNLTSDKLQVQASAKVIQTSNDMLGTLLDIKV